MNGISDDSELRRSIVGSTVRFEHRYERFVAALACASESNLRQLKVLLRTGLGIIFFLEVIGWLEVVLLEPALLPSLRPFFVFDLALVSAALCLTCRRFKHRWRGPTMAFCLILIASRTFSAIAIHQNEPLMLALFVLVLGTAVLVPWSVRWQGIFTLASLIAFAISAVMGLIELLDLDRWLMLTVMGPFALGFTALKDQYRDQAVLIETLLEKKKRLTRSEAMLRTLFDAVPDVVTLTRFSDGQLFEVNHEFLRRTGFTREEALSTSVTRAGAWVRPEERDKYVGQLKETGRVRNLEVDFRLNGVVAPYLMSSVSVEVDGEVYALNVARDATQIREHERALREARERLSAQVNELTSTQTRLRTSEAIIRKLFDAVPDLVTVTRLDDGKFIEVNAEFLRRTGLTREKALSTSTIEIGQWVRPAERDAFRQKLRTDGHVREFEVDFWLQGAVVPYLASSVVIDLEGEACALGVGHDISRIKESERALRQAQERLSAQVDELTATEARLNAEIAEREAAERVAREHETTVRMVFEASPDIITVSSRRDFRLIQANSTFFQETGYSPEEVLGQPIYLKFWANPAQRAQLKQALDRDGAAHNIDADLKMKDGTVNSYLLSTVALELGGEPCRVSFWRNVTEAKRTAQRIARSEAMLRSMFDAIPDIVFMRRGDRVADVNEEFLKCSGLTRAQVLGRPAKDVTIFLRPEDRAEFLRRIQADGIVQNFQADFNLKSVPVPYLVSGAMIETEDGPVLFSISRDISTRIQMEQELIAAREAALAASQAKSEFLSSMSHEIRTPMNAILGMAELLSETELDSEQHRFLDVINANSAALLELINSILDLAKIESGRLQIEKTEFDLTDLVDKTIATFQVRAHSKGLELATRIVPGTPEYLVGDPLRLRQILINLIGNALKFTEVGEVVLLIENDPEGDESGCLRFTVSDTGIGLPPDKLDSIFSNFTQADPSTSRKYGGTGLGLSISQRLTMLMGGRIWVESELGKGSKFIFTLAFGLASEVDTRPRIALPELNGLRVLVVDDNATNRLIAREALTSRGAAVTEAASGEEALEALRSATECGQQHQLILLDMRMPMMDGLEVASRIRHELRASEPLIMMLSSDDLKPELSRLRESGLNAYLVKPITRKELFEAISRVLGEAKSTSGVPPVERTTTSIEEPSDLSSVSILVAEDLAVNRMLVSLFLAPLGCKLDFAENGREALEMFMRSRYSLVLIDIQMPVMDGYDATRGIRDWERAHNAPRTNIVALTASALMEDAVKAREAGCDAHITKPVKKAALLQVIREYSSIPKQETGRAA